MKKREKKYGPLDPSAFTGKLWKDGPRKHVIVTDMDAAPQINLSVLPIDAILNAYSLTVQLILAIREDMTPEQRKAGWLWLEKIQKLIDAALTQPK
jgi:hypothetical protein